MFAVSNGPKSRYDKIRISKMILRIGTDGFEVKSEAERFTVVCPRCRQNLKIWSFHVVVLTSTGDNCSKMRAARACSTCSNVFKERGKIQ